MTFQENVLKLRKPGDCQNLSRHNEKKQLQIIREEVPLALGSVQRPLCKGGTSAPPLTLHNTKHFFTNCSNRCCSVYSFKCSGVPALRRLTVGKYLRCGSPKSPAVWVCPQDATIRLGIDKLNKHEWVSPKLTVLPPGSLVKKS